MSNSVSRSSNIDINFNMEAEGKYQNVVGYSTEEERLYRVIW